MCNPTDPLAHQSLVLNQPSGHFTKDLQRISSACHAKCKISSGGCRFLRPRRWTGWPEMAPRLFDTDILRSLDTLRHASIV